MSFVLTVRQAHEVSRFADRHGPATLTPAGDGQVLVGLDTANTRFPTIELVLNADRRVDSRRRTPAAPAETADIDTDDLRIVRANRPAAEEPA